MTTVLIGVLLKILLPPFKAPQNHPRTIEIRIKSANWLPPGSSTIFFIRDMMGTNEMKNKIPISTLNRVINMTGKDII
jgi:hypothetical protein